MIPVGRPLNRLVPRLVTIDELRAAAAAERGVGVGAGGAELLDALGGQRHDRRRQRLEEVVADDVVGDVHAVERVGVLVGAGAGDRSGARAVAVRARGVGHRERLVELNRFERARRVGQPLHRLFVERVDDGGIVQLQRDRRARAHLDRFGEAPDRQFQIDGEDLVDLDDQVADVRLLEPLQRRGHAVAPRQHADECVVAGVARHGFARAARAGVGQHDRRAGQHAAGRIGHRAGDDAGRRRCRLRAGDGREAEYQHGRRDPDAKRLPRRVMSSRRPFPKPVAVFHAHGSSFRSRAGGAGRAGEAGK